MSSDKNTAVTTHQQANLVIAPNRSAISPLKSSGSGEFIHLADAASSARYGTKVRVPVLVVGKAQHPYLVPADVNVYCGSDSRIHAGRCPLPAEGVSVIFDAESAGITALIAASHTQVVGLILAAVPDRCQEARVRHPYLRTQNIEEIWVQPLASLTLATEGDGRWTVA